MMQEVEVLKTIQELICSFFSEEQFTLSSPYNYLAQHKNLCYNKSYENETMDLNGGNHEKN